MTLTFESALVQYNPRIRLYPKKERNGTVKFYLSYFLPNGKQIKRPCHKKQKEAKRLMSYKERELLRGEFDTLDQKHLGQPLVVVAVDQAQEDHSQITIEEAHTLFLEKTKGRRNAKSQHNDTLALGRMMTHLSKEKTYLKDIRPLDVQNLFDKMDKEGKSEASLKTYARTLGKMFTWYIDDMEVLEMRNPVKKITIAKKRGVVRDHMPTPEEVKALLTTTIDTKSRTRSPIDKIVQFLLYTGCRLGECLHLEWSDINLAEGTLRFQNKPECPTVYGKGWSPKWEKEREIDLFPEAIELLQSLPRYKKVSGKVPVKDISGKVTGHTFIPATFVFPKEEVWFEEDIRKVRYTRVDDVTKTWQNFSKRAGVKGVQIKDFRNYFNYLLINHYGFTHKEAGAYIGNSEEINYKHYSKILRSDMKRKMQKNSLKKMIGM